MRLVRASALIVSVLAVGSPGIGVSLFVEQLLPGLDPVAHGHGGVLPIGTCLEIDLFRGPVCRGNDASAADDVAGWLSRDALSFRRSAPGRSVVASRSIAGLSR